MGWLFYYHESKLGVALAGLMLFAIIPLIFFTRMQIDVIEINDLEIVIRRLNPTQELIRIPKNTSLEVSFEKYGRMRGQQRNPEQVWSLNIWDRHLGFKRRTLLALRVAPTAKEQLYLELIDFLKRNGVNVTT